MTDLVTVSYSELDAFWQCPLKWRLGYAERWNKDEARPALDRGTVWHAMLQTHYELGRLGTPLEGRVGPVLQTMASGGLGAEENELLVWMYDGYCETFLNDAEHDVLATEIRRTIPLPDPDNPSRPGQYALKVVIDNVTRQRRTGQLWAWDHKTGKDFTALNRLEWRPQFPLYTWALRAARLDLWGFIVNHARTQRNKTPMTADQRFKRTFLLYNDRQLTDVAINAARTAAAMHDPDRIEYYASRDLQMGACVSSCDFDGAHRLVQRGVPEVEALEGLGFRKGYERPELQVVRVA